MEDETCYVFKPKAKASNKKRRVEDDAVNEPLDRRKRVFRKEWRKQEDLFNHEMRSANMEFLDQINSFISTTSTEQYDAKIPTAVVLTGLGASSGLFRQLKELEDHSADGVFVLLAASDAPNLKTILRNLIKKATHGLHEEENGDEPLTALHRNSRLLNYDLEILEGFCEKKGLTRVVVSLQDSEAFDTGVLTDLILMLQIPIVLLIGVATSLNMFHDRLPSSAARCLQGQAFDGVDTDHLLERLLESCITRTDCSIRFGPGFIDTALRRAKDSMQGAETFAQSIKFAYMSHFYGNQSSALLGDQPRMSDVQPELFESIRDLPSFQRLVKDMLRRKDAARVQKLLKSNEALFSEIIQQILITQDSITWIIGAIRLLTRLRKIVLLKSTPFFSTLYSKCLTGELSTSPSVREALLAVKKMSSDKIKEMLPHFVDTLMTMPASNKNVSPDDFRDLQEELMALENSVDASLLPLKGGHERMQETFKTTIVSQKVQLNKRKTQLSKHDEEYFQLISRFHDLLESYFSSALVSMKDLPLHEVIFFDLKSVHRDAFNPKPRSAIERAMSSPHDYLGCRCCSDIKSGPSHTQPATSILYQLYLESGSLINAHDLWTAFSAIIADNHDEETKMALFFRGLAELKYMGMIRPSRKRGDHIGKVSWKGL